MNESTFPIPPKISLRAARVNANLLQREAAERIGISKAALQSYENGVTIPAWDTVEKIERTYNYPASFIFFERKTRFKRE